MTSAVYGMSPFMLARGVGHMVLAEAYFVPLSFLYAFIFLKEKKCLSLISSSLKDQSIML